MRNQVKGKGRNIISQSFQEKLDITQDNFKGKDRLTLMHSESFNLQGSFIGSAGITEFNPDPTNKPTFKA